MPCAKLCWSSLSLERSITTGFLAQERGRSARGGRRGVQDCNGSMAVWVASSLPDRADAMLQGPRPHAISFRRIRGLRTHTCHWWHTLSRTRGAGEIRLRPWRTRGTSAHPSPGLVDASSPRPTHTAGTCIYTSPVSLADCVGGLRVPPVPSKDGEVPLRLPPYRKGSIKRAMGPCVTGIHFYSVFGAGVRSKPSNA